MAVVIALYSIAFSLSMGFVLWAVCSFFAGKRTPEKRKLSIQLSPATEPAIVALYCQYLVAPRQAMLEARQMLLAATADQRTAAEVEKISDFFEVLDLLEIRSTASLR